MKIGSISALLSVALFFAGSANAAFVVDITQVGSDVVATGAGTVDLAGLTFQGTGTGTLSIEADNATIVLGAPISSDPSPYAPTDIYEGAINGPASFGNGGSMAASSGSGDLVGIVSAADLVGVPVGYVSGDALVDSDTFDNQTFATLGLTPGTYTYTLPNDTFTINIGPQAGVPEPAFALPVALALGMLLLGGRRRQRAGN